MMPNIQLARFAPGLKLLEMAPGALHRRLHEIVGVVLIARQRAREAAQPRQQLDDAFTDFLRRISHGFMLDNTSGEVIFFRANREPHFRGWLSLSGVGAVAACSCRRCSVPDRASCPAAALPDATRALGGTSARPHRRARAARRAAAQRTSRRARSRSARAIWWCAPKSSRIDITDAALASALEGAIHACCAREELADLGVKITVLQTPEGMSAQPRTQTPAQARSRRHVRLQPRVSRQRRVGSRGRSAPSGA